MPGVNPAFCETNFHGLDSEAAALFQVQYEMPLIRLLVIQQHREHHILFHGIK